MPAIAYHCQARAPISRSAGRSAVASAAYRARARLEDERYGKVQDHSRRGGLEFLWHAAPAGAPEWAHDVGQAWNAVERVEVRRNSTLAFDYDMAFPHQLNAQQREWMLKDWVREGITRKGLIATAAIHEPHQEGDQRNFHAHVMFNDRPVDENGFVRHKDRSVQRTEFMLELKERWAELGARQLERAGFEVEAERWRHGHKTLQQQAALAMERGDLAYAQEVRDREPTTHVGHVATAIERKGRRSERGDLNREVEARNVERREIEVDLAAVRQELERLVQEPDAERQEVDTSPGLGEQRRSNERQAETAAAGAETSETAERSAEDRPVADAVLPPLEMDGLPSAWEIGRSVEGAVDVAEGVAAKGAEVVIALGEGLANALEGSLGGGAIRKAPGGAEYVPPAAAGPPPPLPVTKPPWLEKQEKLRTTSGVEAAEDPAARGKVEEKQGQSFHEQFEELRRRNEQAARERAELYRERDDEDRDRER